MTDAVRFHAQHRAEAETSLFEEVMAGLTRQPKALSPKFFYDRRGSELFEQICQQPEYYPTRTEEQILTHSADEITRLAGPESLLLELGSGASRKIRLLLDALNPSGYLGVDISRDFLLDSTRRLAADYPWLEVHAVWADFSRRMEMPEGIGGRRTVAFFPGSSIGNFEPPEAETFLAGLRQMLPADSGLLIGVDLIKDKAVLEAAYNDAAGFTSEFNLNLLRRLQVELGAELELDNFRHLAFYNDAAERIEMHLVSQCQQRIVVGDRAFEFAPGERLHTENSCKYSIEGFQALAKRAGYTPKAVWTDPQNRFSVHYLSTP